MSAPLRTTIIAGIGAVAVTGVAIVAFKNSGASPQEQNLTAGGGRPAAVHAKGIEANPVRPQSAPEGSKSFAESGSGPELNPGQSTSVAVSAPASDLAVPTKPRYEPGPSKYKNAKRPEVRTILARVGADHEAEALWLQSINDPSVPAKEREDLIEDLNEDGLSDPAKPTRQDLVLIKSRIDLIDRLLPSAMDKVNESAFKEARKDLVNMRTRLEE